MIERLPDRGAPLPGGGDCRPSAMLMLGITVLAAASTAAAQGIPSVSLDDLVEKASRQGVLRVIVELKVDPPGPPSPETIARAQDHVLLELAGTGHRVLRRFRTIPFIGLEVTADALRRLGGSAHVAGVREDMVLRPQGASGTP
jgi:hypothetical protein